MPSTLVNPPVLPRAFPRDRDRESFGSSTDNLSLQVRRTQKSSSGCLHTQGQMEASWVGAVLGRGPYWQGGLISSGPVWDKGVISERSSVGARQRFFLGGARSWGAALSGGLFWGWFFEGLVSWWALVKGCSSGSAISGDALFGGALWGTLSGSRSLEDVRWETAREEVCGRHTP